MNNVTKSGLIKKTSLRVLAPLALLMVLATPGQSRAQMAVSDPITEAQTTAMHIAQIIQDQMSNLLIEWQTAVEDMGKYILALIHTKTADTAAANARTNVDVKTAQEISVARDLPKNYSSCAQAQAAAAAANTRVDANAVAQALSQSNANHPGDAVTNAQDLKLRCTLHMSATAPSVGPPPPEYTIVQKLTGCTNTDAAHAGADKVANSLLGPLQYLVPSELTIVNGVYAPFTSISESNPNSGPVDYNHDYYKFVAAYLFCTHISPTQPQLQPPGSTPTLGLTSIGAYNHNVARIGMAASVCSQFLAERMQCGKTCTLGTPSGSMYKDQQASCQADFNAHYIDQTELTDCNTYGRSALQRAHDVAYREQSHDFQTYVKSVLTPQQVVEETIRANEEEEKFEYQVSTEWVSLGNAMAESGSLTNFNPSPALNQPLGP